MKKIKFTLPLLLLFTLSACAHSPQEELSVPEKRYLAAQKEVKSLPSTQYLTQNGDIYIGDIKGGKAEGFGKLTQRDGTRYTGAFKNNLPHGFGITEASDGALYEGEHRAGEFHGRGKITFSNQSAFMGEFRNNKVYRGLMVFPDGRAVEI